MVQTRGGGHERDELSRGTRGEGTFYFIDHRTVIIRDDDDLPIS